ncbi:MAG: hypothetical protein A3G34_09100 [Candidatus Lindowbacteria bacterium RIFCSPLOWO2_12_FULL_62_27]|nr:MAG: hypothetical protein A3I06_03660 [Candidatus Lindowbacteria bacterium RIFCSPLOWO2_02_FULL_62_12]OGH60145.1 MAG: hypothetical protein A3G34_09100 [Candidatus Lindowbacteria bacterium RIFCSPLOWO2_12_FULL_62_27]
MSILLVMAGCALLGDRPPPPQAVETGMLLQYFNPVAFSVQVAGTFNDWKTSPDEKRIFMKKLGDGKWSVIIPFREFSGGSQVYLQHGQRYQYKFVIDGVDWKKDEGNPRTDVEGTETNSLLIVP